jgi:hypothetical protein
LGWAALLLFCCNLGKNNEPTGVSWLLKRDRKWDSLFFFANLVIFLIGDSLVEERNWNTQLLPKFRGEIWGYFFHQDLEIGSVRLKRNLRPWE